MFVHQLVLSYGNAAGTLHIFTRFFARFFVVMVSFFLEKGTFSEDCEAAESICTLADLFQYEML